MTPVLRDSRVRSRLGTALVAALVVAGFVTLRSDHAALLSGTSDAQVRDRLVQTATEIAGYAWEWHLRPAAFGGGDGRWDGLALHHLGYDADASGHYRTTDGAFSLHHTSGGVEIEATNDRLDVRAVVAIQGGGRAGPLRLVVDGQRVDGEPSTRTRGRLDPPDAARARLQSEADRLADYVELVVGDERTQPHASLPHRPRLQDLGVEVDRDGAFLTPDGPLRLEWSGTVLGRIVGETPRGVVVEAAVRVAPARPEPAEGWAISP